MRCTFSQFRPPPVIIAKMIPSKTAVNSLGVRIVEISQAQSGQRVDNFLIGELKSVPKSHIYRVLRRGEVRVNKGRIKPHYRLKAGDMLRIPPISISEEGEKPEPSSRDKERVASNIIHEDNDLLALNKPSGMAVHGGSGVSYGVIEILRALYPYAYLELAHRLDRDTSGCLLIAKNNDTLKHLHHLLRDGLLNKRYLALLNGHFDKRSLEVAAPLARDVLQAGERMVQVSDQGRAAISRFELRGHYADMTLVQVALLTGRTHQIRVHAAHIGHGVAGDTKYGDAKYNRNMKKYGLKRLFLHAEKVQFNMPDNRRIELQAPLPEELTQVLDQLKMAQGLHDTAL